VVILAQVARRVKRGVAATCPYPRIELGQRSPPRRFPVPFPALVARSIHVLVERVVAVIDLPQERVREAFEERRAERDPLAPPCAREEYVEANLIVEDDR
jgi:hypothetical protein